MKIKINLALLLFLALAGSARAADKTQPALTVAVYDFAGTDKNSGSLAGKVTTLVTAGLTSETNLVLLERAELSKALSEQAFNVSGMVSSDAAAKIGAITGAKVLVAGQVIKLEGNHVVIIASIIGTETGRLFTAKVEGSPDKLLDLTAGLSRKIGQTISDQAANLMLPPKESTADRLNRIVNNISGTNRPSVSVNIMLPAGKGRHSSPAESELGAILLKAGFTVVDASSDRKPDVEITGVVDISTGPRRGNLASSSAVIELKLQERRSGTIIAFDRQESTATDVGLPTARRLAQVNAVDDLAERILRFWLNKTILTKL